MLAGHPPGAAEHLTATDLLDLAEALLFEELASEGMDRSTFVERLAEPWAPVEELWGTGPEAEAQSRAMMGADVQEPAPMREG